MSAGLSAIVYYKFYHQEPTISEHAITVQLMNQKPYDNPVYLLEPFIVNIKDKGQSRYLRTTIDLELDQNLTSEEINNKIPILRHEINTLLGAKEFEDISTIQGKLFLKDEVVYHVNKTLDSGRIKDAFFTEFIIE